MARPVELHQPRAVGDITRAARPARRRRARAGARRAQREARRRRRRARRHGRARRRRVGAKTSAISSGFFSASSRPTLISRQLAVVGARLRPRSGATTSSLVDQRDGDLEQRRARSGSGERARARRRSRSSRRARSRNEASRPRAATRSSAGGPDAGCARRPAGPGEPRAPLAVRRRAASSAKTTASGCGPSSQTDVDLSERPPEAKQRAVRPRGRPRQRIGEALVVRAARRTRPVPAAYGVSSGEGLSRPIRTRRSKLRARAGRRTARTRPRR